MLVNKRYIPPERSSASCQLCQDLDIPIGLGGRIDYRALGIPVQELSLASKGGCTVCNILFESVTKLCAPLKGFPPVPKEEVFGITICSDSKDKPLIVNVLTENAHVLDLEIYTHPDCPSCWPLVGPGRNVSSSGLSQECISLAMEWMNECSRQHPHCAKNDNSALPARVLDVSDSLNIHLYVTKVEEHGKYIALSHCWGGDVPLKTTSRTLQPHMNGIAFPDFPKTFQDAITVCQLLGVRFLWIDSLCIVQDSRDDWAEQSARMSDIYAKAFVTISADGASNSLEGFLEDKRREIMVCKFSVPGNQSENVELSIRRRGSRGYDSFSHHVWAGPAASPLARRGWVLQESVLSNRILHFTAEELTWECRNMSRCECQYVEDESTFASSFKLAISNMQFHTRWSYLVAEFTDRTLTYWTDRLAAISGIAQDMRQSSNAEYWAGLWSDTFPHCLLWVVIDRHKSGKLCASKRIQPYHAPTWSWASVTGRIILPSVDPDGYHGQVTSVKCIPVTSNSFGSLHSAELQMEGMLIEIEIHEGACDEHPGAKFHCFSKLTTDRGKICAMLEPDVYDGGDEIRKTDQYWALLVTTESTLNGLIALRAARNKNASYERVGFLYLKNVASCLSIAVKQTIVLV